MKQKKRQTAQDGGRLLRRFSLSYFALLIIPIALCIGAYLAAMDQAERNLLDRNRLVISHSLDRLESSVQEASRFTLTLSAMGDITGAMQQADPYEPSSIYSINQAIEQLSIFTDANSIISGYCLYAAQGDYILAPSKAYLNLARYHENSLQYDGLDYESFRAQVLDMANVAGYLPEMEHILLSSSRQRSITLFRPFVAAASPQSNRLIGKAIFFLNVASIEKLLSPALAQADAQAFVLDRQGNVLMSLGAGYAELPAWHALTNAEGIAKVQMEGKTMAVTALDGAATGLRIAVATPMQAVYSQVSAVTNPLLIVLVTLLAIGIGFAFLIARTNRRPLVNIIGRLPEDTGEKQGISSLWDVDRAVHRLTDSQQLLRRQLDEQKSQMRSAFIHQLVTRGVSDEMEMETLLRHMDIAIGGNVYRGVYMEVRGELELSEDALIHADFTQSLVIQALASFGEAIQYLSMLDYAHFILIYSADRPESEDERVVDLFGELYRRLNLEHGLQPLFFLGYECASFGRLHKSFSAAFDLMEICERKSGQFLFIEEAEKRRTNGYRYTVGDEQRLVALASKGKADAIRMELDRIYDENFLSQRLDSFMQQLLYHRMAATLALSSEHAVDLGVLDRSLAVLSPRAFFDTLYALYAKWCKASLDRLEASQHQLIQRVLEHIHKNYPDDRMGLASVALRYGVTESHLSVFFKEKVGKTFSAYLEAIRIQNANELLMTTQRTIDEIAREVGYTNADSFRRAYKRVHGYAPSQRRSDKL